MTRQELEQAKGLLAERAERFEAAGVDGGGWCLTAHWHGGGQKLFYSLDTVNEWLDDRTRAEEGF